MDKDEAVFLFEYSVCSSMKMHPETAVEGEGMFKTLYEGFSKPISFYNRHDYLDCFNQYLDKAAFVLAIAPETDAELLKLTKMIEVSDCNNLGSRSIGVKIASDKYLTYKLLKKFSPKTRPYKGKSILDLPVISKPRDGISCEGVNLIKDEKELQNVPEGFLIQDFVEGTPMSACFLIGEDMNLISINTQEIQNFEYKGAKLPVELSNSHKKKIADAVEKIPGLSGFIGVDFILSKEGPVIIEINPRPVTPIMALKEVFGINIAQAILDNYNGKKAQTLNPRKKVRLIKKISPKSGYTIEIRQIYEDLSF